MYVYTFTQVSLGTVLARLVYLSWHLRHCGGKNTVHFHMFGSFYRQHTAPTTHTLFRIVLIVLYTYSSRGTGFSICQSSPSFYWILMYVCSRKDWQFPHSHPKTCLHVHRTCFMSFYMLKKICLELQIVWIYLWEFIYFAINGIFSLVFTDRLVSSK